MAHLTIVDHPLVRRDLTLLRRRDTPHGRFREVLARVATYVGFEALRLLEERPVRVQTPLEETGGHEPSEEVVIVPVLRAGLGMVDGLLRLVPDARVGHVGLYRDERSFEPVSYYERLPEGLAASLVLVVDPMLATGGSATEALKRLRAAGAVRMAMVALVAAPEGVARLERDHPGVPVFAAALDRQLDENAYIRPGLGDAGDRVFGTN